MIVTKLDGDTRGGAALSIKAVTGRPILYVGMGEKLSDLEQFYPDRMGIPYSRNGRRTDTDRESRSGA